MLKFKMFGRTWRKVATLKCLSSFLTLTSQVRYQKLKPEERKSIHSPHPPMCHKYNGKASHNPGKDICSMCTQIKVKKRIMKEKGIFHTNGTNSCLESEADALNFQIQRISTHTLPSSSRVFFLVVILSAAHRKAESGSRRYWLFI